MVYDEMPASMASQRIAIATLWDGVPDYACAVMHYCQHAQRLADVFVHKLGVRSTDLLMMLTDDHLYETDSGQCRCKHKKKKFCPECSSASKDEATQSKMPERLSLARATVAADCPQMKLHTLDPRLKEATRKYTESPYGGCRNKWQATCMYKWWTISLVEYSLVILADLDVQLLRPEQPIAVVTERWRRTWTYAVPTDGRPKVLADGDHWTPFNGGLWTLGNPSRELYEDGLAQLRAGVWNASHGFNHVGTPEEIVKRRPDLYPRMQHTHMLHQNTWNFAFGDCDQGFLYHMFYLSSPKDGGRRPGGDFEPLVAKCSKTSNDTRCPHTARHYWGPKKPWQLEQDNAGRVAHYLAHTDFKGRSSPCAQRFMDWAQRLPRVDPLRPPKKHNGKLQRIR
jgi:hypothetical protein